MATEKFIIEATVENPHVYGFLVEKDGRKFLDNEMRATRYLQEDLARVEQELREFLGHDRPCKIRTCPDPYRGTSMLGSLAANLFG